MGRTRIMVVGCGGIAGAWLPTLSAHPDVEIVGLVDLNKDVARKRADEYKLANAVVGDDVRAMLAAAKPEVVCDLTIPAAHAEVTIAALDHGCHVLGEKPLADSLDNAKRMLVAAQRNKRTYAVMQNRRFNPRMRQLRRLIAAGTIGDIVAVKSDFQIGAHFGGFRDRMKHVLILDMAIHTFDQARMLTGADATQVWCKEWNPKGSWYDHDAAAIAVFTMSGGARYTYYGSWCAEGCNTSWEAEWRITGTEGTVLWDGNDLFRCQRVAKRGEFFSTMEDVVVPPAEPDDRVGQHDGWIKDTIACLRSGRTPETVCTDNVKSLAMVFGAIESSDSGATVSIG
ncbi:MAG TPA: Gfo/Idh/MocA family oxidoreductase [Planctomycetota bacterium]|nr:Gfo/Idh/MocA family oxidoreductase [Planctomycetota bacterium]